MRGAWAAVLAALLISGCAVIPAEPEAMPSDWVPEPTVEPEVSDAYLSPDGFSAAQRMTLRMRNIGCGFVSTGTGFAIDAYTLVTNRHVISDSNMVQVTTYDGRVITVRAVSATTVADIAIITTEQSLGSAFAVRANEDPVEGDIITVVGYPLGGKLTTATGVVLDQVSDPLKAAVGKILATSAAVESGSSGSPALNEDGEVVGVVYAKNEVNQSFIVPVSTLNSLLAEPALLVPQSSGCAS